MSEFGGIGRPTADETQARTKELLRLVSGGASLADAASQAHVKPDRVLRLLDSQEFFQVYSAIREGKLGPTAVTLESALDAAA